MKKIISLIVISVLFVACGKDVSLFQQAKLATSKGNYPKALSLYNQLIKQNPQHAAALVNRGLIWEKMPAKDIQEKAKNRSFAEADYLRALDINPNQPETYNNLGALYMDTNRNGEAVQYFSQAIALNPSYFRALMNRGVAYSKIGQFSLALNDFDAAAQLRPNDPALLFNRGLAYFDMNKYEAADNDLSHAIAVQPNNARLYLERARVLIKMGYPADAYEDLEQAIALKPDYALAYYYLGDLMYRNGDSDFALGALVKAKELASEYVPTYDLMGDMLAAEDPVAATANYLVALKLDPANASKYRRKIELMKTSEGRYYVTTARFFPEGRKYDSTGHLRFAARPIPTGAQANTQAANRSSR